jgi:hypothetical protein
VRTVIVVDAGGETESVTVVVRLTVVVVVGGGVETTSSLVHALKQAAALIAQMRYDSLFMSAKSKLRAKASCRIYVARSMLGHQIN